ncbi:MAG TPA: hypothetical protein VF789_18305 [Thermoanaerobaculia bacterium]
MWTQYRDLLDAAKDIESAWRREGNACEAFPQIVWERTEGLELSDFGEVANVPELLETAAIASLQHPSTFSDLYFKLYDNGKFWIEVLNWWGSDINVHDHNFSGVQFQLRGQSLNVIYRFAVEIAVAGLALGEVSVASAELWNEGDRSIVLPGTAQPHNVSHLSIPTVSLLIRTYPNASYGGQSNYFAPDIAADYSVADIVFRKKLATLRLLARGNSTAFHRAFERVLAHHTHTENLFTLIKLIDLIFVPQYIGLVHDYAAQGELETVMVRAVAYHRAQDFLTNTVKYVPGLSLEEILAVSVLAASFSQSSLNVILSHLTTHGVPLDMARVLAGVDAKLPPDLQSQFRASLTLFGIDYGSQREAA